MLNKMLSPPRLAHECLLTKHSELLWFCGLAVTQVCILQPIS